MRLRGDRLDDTMQQLDIFQLDASTYFLAIYQLLELEMTTLGRQIDDLNLHSPSSLVFKKTERLNFSVWHVRVLSFHSDVRFLARRFCRNIGVLVSDVFGLAACVAIGVCN